MITLWSAIALWFYFLLFPNTNSCLSFYVTDRINILLGKNTSTETFKYLFHGFHSSFFFSSLSNFFYCFCFTITSFSPSTQHLWPLSHTLQVPAYHHTMPAKLLNSESGNTQNWAITGEFQGVVIYANTMFLAHMLQGKYWIPHPGYGSKQSKKPPKLKITEYSHLYFIFFFLICWKMCLSRSWRKFCPGTHQCYRKQADTFSFPISILCFSLFRHFEL